MRSFRYLLLAVVLCACGSDDSSGAPYAVPSDAGSTPHEAGPLPPPAECGAPTGSSWYVSPDGDDANPGTQASPWKTLAKGAGAASPGDTVYLMPGVWSEQLVPQRSGDEGAWITFAAASTSDRPVIDGTSLSGIDGGLVWIEGKSWIKLCNLVVRGSAQHGVMAVPSDEDPTAHLAFVGLAVDDSGEAGIYLEGVQSATIEQCATHDSVSSGIGVWYSSQIAVRGNTVVNARYDEDRGHEESISISGTEDFDVSDNEVYLEPGVPCTGGNAAIKAKESSQRGAIHHNYVHDFYPEGHISLDAWEAGLQGTPTLNTIDIYANKIVSSGGIRISSEELGTVENIRIYNNLVLRTDNGIMITDAGKGGPRRHIAIYNNTVYEGNDEWFNGIYVMTLDAEDIIIRNNIVASHYNVAKLMAMSTSLAAQVTADHNLVYGPESCLDGYADCLLLSSGPGNTTADPLFVDAPGGDLHLTAASPAVDTGAEVDGLTEDFDGVSRPQGAATDIGALELQP